MKKAVNEYLKSLHNLHCCFGFGKEYLVKPMIDCKWNVRKESDIPFINYWGAAGGIKTAVIVRKNGSPMIYKSGEFTVIIAIDCVKTAFLLRNSNYE